MNTIGQILEDHAVRIGEADAVIFSDENIRLSWEKLHACSDHVAKGLLSYGIQRGDHVAVWGTNRLPWLLTQLAAAKIGAPLVTMNPEWKAAELSYALKQSDSRVLIMTEGFKKTSGDRTFHYDYVSILKEVLPELPTQNARELKCKECPELRTVFLFSPKEQPGFVPWEMLFRGSSQVSQAEYSRVCAEVTPEDTALIQYTSGTTGFPKGAMLTHQGILSNARTTAANMKFTQHDRLCGPVPYYHCFGSILVNMVCLATGATAVIPAEHFHPTKTLNAIHMERCTALHGVPTMFLAILADPALAATDTSSLRTGVMAGAPCPKELMERVMNTLNLHEITIGYGLTEASPLTHQTIPEDPVELRVATVGRAIPGTEARIVNPQTHETCSIGEVGEIWVKGPNVMPGYYKKPAETEAAIIDGWLRTGDLGSQDEHGYFRISGRLKEMILVGGHNVYPAEVEQQLLSAFPRDIESVQIVGIAHDKLQEVSAAVVKLHAGASLSASELIARAEKMMEWPKVPRVVKVVSDFSNAMTVTGKIQKFKLKEMLERELRENRSQPEKTMI